MHTVVVGNRVIIALGAVMLLFHHLLLLTSSVIKVRKPEMIVLVVVMQTDVCMPVYVCVFDIAIADIVVKGIRMISLKIKYSKIVIAPICIRR